MGAYKRKTGFEPATPTWQGDVSTTELLPHVFDKLFPNQRLLILHENLINVNKNFQKNIKCG